MRMILMRVTMGKINVFYHKRLKKRYYYKEGGVMHFEDQVDYSPEEQMILTKQKLNTHELRMMHNAKRLFNGEITTRDSPS